MDLAALQKYYRRHHGVRGLRGQALEDAVNMSVAMQLSQRAFEAEAQLRAAAEVSTRALTACGR